jgi:hypothetical protein
LLDPPQNLVIKLSPVHQPALRAATFTTNVSEHSQTVTLIHLRQIAKALYMVLEPHPGLQPRLKPKRVNPPPRKGCWIAVHERKLRDQ